MARLHSLFAYGTLQFPEVVRAVLGRNFAARRAVLPGYARFVVRGADYPAIVPEPGAETPGVLLDGLDASTLELLDEFEGDFYRRRRVSVIVEDTSTVVAETYVVADGHVAALSSDPWDAAEFARSHLRRFLAGYAGFGRMRSRRRR